MHRLLQKKWLWPLIFAMVLLVNLPVIQFDMMYPEQSLEYVANQHIHRFSDLINIYLHPQLFHIVIPFFRPSGHYLMYQLLTPIFGWHQTRLWITVNFLFLAASGCVLISLYRQLFKGYWLGGFIAFAIYLMHPSISLIKLSILHFEFAYIFFLLLGLTLFVDFCQQNSLSSRHLAGLKFFVGALLCYIVSVTFKEPAVMLGPIYLLYFLMSLDHQEKLTTFCYKIGKNPVILRVMIALCSLSFAMGVYMLVGRPRVEYYFHSIFMVDKILSGMTNLFYYLFNWQIPYVYKAFQNHYPYVWCSITFSVLATFIMALSLMAFAVTSVLLSYENDHYRLKQSLVFLLLAAVVFLILPIGWGESMPWHYHTALVMLSLVFGFSFDYLSKRYFHHERLREKLCLLFALLIALTTIITNNQNINTYATDKLVAFPLALIRHAVKSPPPIQYKLHDDTIIVIEDKMVNNAYLFGAATYPFYLTPFSEYTKYYLAHQNDAVRFDQSYSGSLFKWAYLNPNIREEVFPFQIEFMGQVENEIIYQWLQEYKHIICLGYDEEGRWFDKTREFKEKLLEEQQRRRLFLRPYYVTKRVPAKRIAYQTVIPFPDPLACRYLCDRATSCGGYTYTSDQLVHQCVMYQ